MTSVARRRERAAQTRANRAAGLVPIRTAYGVRWRPLGWSTVQDLRRAAQVESWMLRGAARLAARPMTVDWPSRGRCRRFRPEQVVPSLCTSCPVRMECCASALHDEQETAHVAFTRAGFLAVDRQRFYRTQLGKQLRAEAA
jgi:hypothetical protein